MISFFLESTSSSVARSEETENNDALVSIKDNKNNQHDLNVIDERMCDAVHVSPPDPMSTDQPSYS
jgi:hypothetical protein